MQSAENYLRLAYEADRAALGATSRANRNCWEFIAGVYRKLAMEEFTRSPEPAPYGEAMEFQPLQQ